MTTSEIQRRLNALFWGLWANRNGVRGSWGASSYRYHPTYIRRGPLLLCGETKFYSMYVLSPGDCEVIPVYGNARANCNTFPIVKGEVIRVSLQEEGPWLDYLAKEIPKMEAELEESCRRIREAEQKEMEERAAKRRAELEAAAAVFMGKTQGG